MKKLLISLLILIAFVIGIVVLFNIKSSDTGSKNNKISIVTTLYPVYDFAREIAGENADVSMLISPGVEIHDYEPTPQDIIKIQEADLFLYLGEELEPWAETVISGIENRKNLKNITSNIDFIKLEEHHDEHSEHGEYDTHIWLDPNNSIQMVRNITEQLCQKDPANKEYYTVRCTEYVQSLEKLDSEFEQVIQNSMRNEIAFGGPFSYSYFINRYGLDYISAYDSCGENSEPSVDKIFSVIEEIKKNNLPVVFYKELSSGNIVKTISEETGAEMLEFNSLHTITEKQLQDGETYLSIMYENLENLKKALN